MIGLANIARTGLRAAGGKVDTTAGNIANANTPGYIRKEGAFSSLLVNDLRQSQVPAQDNVQGGLGASMVQRHDFSQGHLVFTGNQFDLGIQGDGFFRLELDGDEIYSQGGNFSLDSNGNVVHSSGALLPGINLGEGDMLEVTPDGMTWLISGDQRSQGPQINLYRFVNPQGLEHKGAGTFIPTDAAGEPQIDEGSHIKQGFLRGANVELSEEMTQLLMAQRAFQANSSGIRMADDMWDLANRIKG